MSKEPTLRLFLEDLNTNPEKYRNAMVINLHGELLPMPALRNHAAALAKMATLCKMPVITTATEPHEWTRWFRSQRAPVPARMAPPRRACRSMTR